MIQDTLFFSRVNCSYLFRFVHDNFIEGWTNHCLHCTLFLGSNLRFNNGFHLTYMKNSLAMKIRGKMLFFTLHLKYVVKCFLYITSRVARLPWLPRFFQIVSFHHLVVSLLSLLLDEQFSNLTWPSHLLLKDCSC